MSKWMDFLRWLLETLGLEFSVTEKAFSGTFEELYEITFGIMDSLTWFANTLFWEYHIGFMGFDLSFSIYSLLALSVAIIIIVMSLLSIVKIVVDIIS